jgi:hypothetical protein
MAIHQIVIKYILVFIFLSGHIISCTSEPPTKTTDLANNLAMTVTAPATLATVAVMPTMDTDQAYVFLESLIPGNPNCQLPCWGGIEPGVTSNEEAVTRLQPLSTLIYGGPFYPYKGKELSGPGGGRDFFFGDTKIQFDFGWVTERGKDTVEFLGINADAIIENSGWVYDSEPYHQLFEIYNLHNIIFTYGYPSEILTIAEVYDYGDQIVHPNREEFYLLLVYDKGILINYTMPLNRIGDGKGKACPSEAFFDMILVPSGMGQFYRGMLFSTITDSQDSSPYLPIDESTQMTLDEFNQAFKESNTACFETPLSIWPPH